MTQSEESEFLQYSSGLMAAESVVNIDPRHMKDVVMSGHLPIKAMIVPWPPEGIPIPIPCQFNPNEITYDVGANYKNVFGDKLEPMRHPRERTDAFPYFLLRKSVSDRGKRSGKIDGGS